MFRKHLACSFCAKPDSEVEKLVAGPRLYGIAGPRVYICNKCVAVVSQIMESSETPAPHPATSWSDSTLVVVRTYLNKFEAQVAKTALDAADIDSVIRADDAGGNATGLWMTGVRLLVNEADAERADEVLQ